MKRSYKICIIFGMFFAFAYAQPIHAACISLSYDLSFGSNDRTTGGQVTVLQTYLATAGYLSATPNGNFGPATRVAVQKFQIANGISATGTVGPLTRAAFSIRSCGTVPAQTTQNPQTTQTPSVSSAQKIAVTVPQSGETLRRGEPYIIKWSGPSDALYSIILDNASGTSQGFIISRFSGNQYPWTIGDVFVNNNPASSVPPGTYRIRVENVMKGSQSTDVPSGLFTITAPPVVIETIFPSSITAGTDTSVVVYGSGFVDSSKVDIYGYRLVSPTFISSDKKVIVFTVPSTLYAGWHGITVTNQYSDDISARSNQVNLTLVR